MTREERIAKLILREICDNLESTASDLRQQNDSIDNRIAGALDTLANKFDEDWLLSRIRDTITS
jgi:hypothetical protein